MTIEDQLNGGGIETVLFDENPRGQRLGRVVSADGHGRLEHDGTGVELARYQVHRRSRDSYAVVECLTLRFDARERRQERRMDVQNRVGERVQQRRADQPHESREADQPDAAAQELLRNGAVELVT